MSKRIIGVACFAVFALGTCGSALASPGGHWMVEGHELGVGETREFLPNGLVLNPGHFIILVGPPNILFQCLGHFIGIEQGKIIGPDNLLIKSIVFKECASPPPCPFEVGEIRTVPVHGLASLDLPGSLNAYILILPETKNVLATVKFIGTECALAGTQPITGDLSFLIHEASHEKLLHLILAFSLPKALHIGSVELDLLGFDFDLALASHELWSFL